MTARCNWMVDRGRRRFLTGGAAAAGGVALGAGPARAADPGPARIAYPSRRLANLADLAENEPFDVAYPDAAAPGVLLKLGRPVEGGVGPEGDVVGFTAMCPHKGYALAYVPERRTLQCPGHHSIFDPEKGGQQVWGHATQNLPQYALRVDEAGDVHAEGIDELLYGRLSNVLGGEEGR